jgi:hypothetical protein
MILDFCSQGCIHNECCASQLCQVYQEISDVLVSGSSYQSHPYLAVWLRLDTLRDMYGDHTWQLIVNMRLRGLFAPDPYRAGIELGIFRSQNSLNLSMT